MKTSVILVTRNNHTWLYDYCQHADSWEEWKLVFEVMMRKKALKRSAGRPPLASVARLESTILEAASKVFGAKGFSAATMRQVAGEAGMSPQTVYARFADKTQLYEALMEMRTTALLGAMGVPLEDGAPPREALQGFGETLLSTFLGTDLQRLHQMVIGEAKTFPGLARTFFTAGPGRGRTLLLAYLSECVARGELRIAQIEIAADQFIGALVGSVVMRSTLAQGARLRGKAEISEWVRVAVETFLRAYGTER